MIFRKGVLFAVMLGALALSFNGQVETIRVATGGQMAVVFALTMDIASLAGLHELMSARRREMRGWAWTVLVVAGGTSLSLNTWHTVRTGELPTGFAILIGVVPVVLAGVLSHLLALSMAAEDAEEDRRASASEAGGMDNGRVQSVRRVAVTSTAAPSEAGVAGIEPAPARRRKELEAAKPAASNEPGEVTEELLARAAEVDANATRTRAGYRTLKDALDISEPLARKVRTALDERQAAGGQVIPMHRGGDDPAVASGDNQDPGWRSEDEDADRHPAPAGEVAR